jgi:hypothetical protein
MKLIGINQEELDTMGVFSLEPFLQETRDIEQLNDLIKNWRYPLSYKQKEKFASFLHENNIMKEVKSCLLPKAYRPRGASSDFERYFRWELPGMPDSIHLFIEEAFLKNQGKYFKWIICWPAFIRDNSLHRVIPKEIVQSSSTCEYSLSEPVILWVRDFIKTNNLVFNPDNMGPPHVGCFSSMAELEIEDCYNISSAITHETIESLRNVYVANYNNPKVRDDLWWLKAASYDHDMYDMRRNIIALLNCFVQVTCTKLIFSCVKAQFRKRINEINKLAAEDSTYIADVLAQKGVRKTTELINIIELLSACKLTCETLLNGISKGSIEKASLDDFLAKVVKLNANKVRISRNLAKYYSTKQST